MNRRQWVALGGTGAAAALAGALFAVMKERRAVTAAADPATGQPAGADAALAFWDARFDTLDGQGLVPRERFFGRPLLLNFWATWCAPCVKEMPELNRFQREFGPQGWQVLGLAVDAPTPVRQFLTKLPVDFPVALAGLTGTELSRQLGNQRGGLPFSVAFDTQGQPIWYKLGATDLEELRKFATALR